jgi:hypothetical protein
MNVLLYKLYFKVIDFCTDFFLIILIIWLSDFCMLVMKKSGHFGRDKMRDHSLPS